MISLTEFQNATCKVERRRLRGELLSEWGRDVDALARTIAAPDDIEASMCGLIGLVVAIEKAPRNSAWTALRFWFFARHFVREEILTYLAKRSTVTP